MKLLAACEKIYVLILFMMIENQEKFCGILTQTLICIGHWKKHYIFIKEN